MVRKYHVDILVDNLAPSSAPVYRADGDEEWYFLDSDGRTWRTCEGSKVRPPEFEMVHGSKNALMRQVHRALASICMLQEHGGTAIIAVRSCRQAPGVGGGASLPWVLTGSLIMTSKPVTELAASMAGGLEGVPPHIVIDDKTMEYLDYMDMVEEVHAL